MSIRMSDACDISNGNWSHPDFKIRKSNLEDFALPPRKESSIARERLQLAASISDDVSLLKLEEYVAEYVREATPTASSRANCSGGNAYPIPAPKFGTSALRRSSAAWCGG